jgi:hypothetical protein
MMVNPFDRAYEENFIQLVRSHLAEAEAKHWPCDRWCGFWPAIGHSYGPGGLMIIGRALNGWDTTFTTAEANENICSVVEKCRQSFASGNGTCPIHWVEDRWGKSEKGQYRTSRSALFRMAKKLMEYFGHEGEGWTGHFCWNNMMRVSPSCSGNPPGWSCEAQSAYAVDLLRMEMAVLQPAVVVFFTGDTWFRKWVAKHLEQDVATGTVCDSPHVFGGGFLGDSKVVIAPHPMGKKEDVLMAELKRLL